MHSMLRTWLGTALCGALLGFAASPALAQTDQFTYLKGSTATNANGTYGTQGVAAVANNPGARESPATWTDAQGNLWLFGGFGRPATGTTNGRLGDMWRYTPADNQWTWVSGVTTINNAGSYGTQGVASATNNPPGRNAAASWVGANGNFYLFAGVGTDSTGTNGQFGDVWSFNPANNQWTWLKGPKINRQAGVYGTLGVAAPTNNPGGRERPAHMQTADGSLYVFGGLGRDAAGNSGRLNDLWRYEESTNAWTWVSGSTVESATGIYGTQGNYASTNSPGGRTGALMWLATDGDPIVFGGQGYDNAGTLGFLNDVWRYDLTTGNWAWVKGANTTNALPVYGTEDVFAAANTPSARNLGSRWQDTLGRKFLFGGIGRSNSGNTGSLADIWQYNDITNEWAWVAGLQTVANNGVYGTAGVAAATNRPGTRFAAGTWVSSTGSLFFFGGSGLGASGTLAGGLNDLWKYEPAVPPAPPTFVAQLRAADCGYYGFIRSGTSGRRAVFVDTTGAAATVSNLPTVYRFTFTYVSGSTPQAPVVRTTIGNNLGVNFAGLKWGTTYTVTVAAGNTNGFGMEGPACTIATVPLTPPATQLRASDCGYMLFTLAGPRNYALPVVVTGATQYRYELTPVDSNNAAIGSPIFYTGGRLEFPLVTGLAQGQPYAVRVAAGFGGTFGPYGTPCNVMVGVPAPPRIGGTASNVALLLAPNPVNAAVGATLHGAALTGASLVDLSGRVVATYGAASGMVVGVGAGLPAGIYLIRAALEGSQTQVLRLVITQ